MRKVLSKYRINAFPIAVITTRHKVCKKRVNLKPFDKFHILKKDTFLPIAINGRFNEKKQIEINNQINPKKYNSIETNTNVELIVNKKMIVANINGPKATKINNHVYRK